MATKAMTLVYLRESNLLRYDKGITTSLEMKVSKIQKEAQVIDPDLRVVHHLHKCCDPKMPINQISYFSCSMIKA